MHLIRIFAFESCEVDRRHTEKVLRPVVQTIDLKLRLLRRVTGQRRIVSTQALYAYVKPVERNVGAGLTSQARSTLAAIRGNTMRTSGRWWTQ